ncbi:hypothetical protein EST38_g8492 [Candolleomyces aberdarensis]|uniref:Uncharacterized protein n=1 Tax=Candolleomyces aberdarensis TaxID=2316362 RepID=A0A4V1Q350_9AGAR|nr:hypothetical protein EST38_g8492 [Candolleomyces aberdarensis]
MSSPSSNSTQSSSQKSFEVDGDFENTYNHTTHEQGIYCGNTTNHHPADQPEESSSKAQDDAILRFIYENKSYEELEGLRIKILRLHKKMLEREKKL